MYLVFFRIVFTIKRLFAFMFLSRSDKSSTLDHFYLPQNQNIFGDGFEKNVKNGKRCETVFSYVVAVLHQDGSCGFKNIYIHISHGIDKKCLRNPQSLFPMHLAKILQRFKLQVTAFK